MATIDTTIFKEKSVSRPLPKLEIGENLRIFLEKAHRGVTEFVEYAPCEGRQGSTESNWVPVDWFYAKVTKFGEGILKRRGERT